VNPNDDPCRFILVIITIDYGFFNVFLIIAIRWYWMLLFSTKWLNVTCLCASVIVAFLYGRSSSVPMPGIHMFQFRSVNH
jgi:uncharacterized membrane protein